jgi:hypothetical protein
MNSQATLGLMAAAAASLAINGSYLVQTRALASTPAISVTRPVATLLSLLRSPSWLAGATLGYGGLALEVVALCLAPVALVQSVVAGGLVVVAVGSARVARHPVARGEAAAVGLMLVAVIGLSIAPAARPAPGPPSVLALTVFMALPAVAALALARRRGGSPARLGLIAGVLYGATTTALAVCLSAWRAGAVLTPVTAVAVGCGVVVTAAGFFAFQRALQSGHPVPVVTAMMATMNAVAIAGGLLLLGESLGAMAWQRALHLAAYVLVCIAAVLAAPGLSGERPLPARRAVPAT